MRTPKDWLFAAVTLFGFSFCVFVLVMYKPRSPETRPANEDPADIAIVGSIFDDEPNVVGFRLEAWLKAIGFDVRVSTSQTRFENRSSVLILYADANLLAGYGWVDRSPPLGFFSERFIENRASELRHKFVQGWSRWSTRFSADSHEQETAFDANPGFDRLVQMVRSVPPSTQVLVVLPPREISLSSGVQDPNVVMNGLLQILTPENMIPIRYYREKLRRENIAVVTLPRKFRSARRNDLLTIDHPPKLTERGKRAFTKFAFGEIKKLLETNNRIFQQAAPSESR